MKAKLKEHLLKAKENKYAVPAFNFDNLDMMKGIIQAAEEENSPVILMVRESAAKHIGIEIIFSMIKKTIEKSKTQIILHWDHGFDIDLVKKAIDMGFSSVMLDSLSKSFAENINITKHIVEYAHAKDVEVEAEIGLVCECENDDKTLKINVLTNIDEAIVFDRLTNIDALAVSIGTKHGKCDNRNLQFDLLKKISEKINTPLVLHGSSGIPDKDLQKTIDLGITKINIETDLRIAYASGIKNYFQNNPDGFDAKKFGTIGMNFVKEEAIKKIRAVRANNRI